jgi:hypothetical protein
MCLVICKPFGYEVICALLAATMKARTFQEPREKARKGRYMPDQSNAGTRFPLVLWIYAAASLIAAFLVGLRPLNFIADDSLFYLVIGDRISHGEGSTFNGLFPTNGYHPLWELIASTLALLPHTKGSLALYGAVAQSALLIATLWLLMAALRQFLDRPAMIVFAAVMLVFFVPMGNLYWSEGPLNMFFVALALHVLLSERQVPYAGFGVILGLLFLSRLDNVFLVGCIVTGLWLRDRDRRIVITCLTCAAVAGTYLAVNLVQYGHLMPISGAVKSASYRGVLFAGRLGPFGTIGLLGALGLGASNLLNRRRPVHYRVTALILACGVVLQCLYVLVFTLGDTTWIWYYVQGYLCLALLAAEAVSAAGSSLPLPEATAGAAFGLALLLAGGLVAVQWSGWMWHGRAMHNSTWRRAWLTDLERHVPDDHSVLIVGDQPGLFAFGTSHPVFALDGLTSNYAFDAELANHQMYGEIARFGPAYLIAPIVQPGSSLFTDGMQLRGVAGGQIIHFVTPLANANAGCIFLDNSGLLSARVAPPPLYGGTWGLWKLTPDTMHQTLCC